MLVHPDFVKILLKRLEQVSQETNLEYPIWHYICSGNFEFAKRKTSETLAIMPFFLLMKIMRIKSKEEIIVLLGFLEYYNFLKSKKTKYEPIPDDMLPIYWELYLVEVNRLSNSPPKNDKPSGYVKAMEQVEYEDHDATVSEQKLQDLLVGLRGLYLVLLNARIILHLDLYQVFKYVRDDMRSFATRLPKLAKQKDDEGWYEVFGPDGTKKSLGNHEALLVGSHSQLQNSGRSGLYLHGFEKNGVSRINCAIIYLPDRGEEGSRGTILIFDFGSYQGLNVRTEDGQTYESTREKRQIIMVPAGTMYIGIGNDHAVTLTVKFAEAEKFSSDLCFPGNDFV